MKMSQRQLDGFLSPIFEESFKGKGKWSDTTPRRVMMSMIRRRPRDLVKLLTLAGRQAAQNRSSRIGTIEFEYVFVDYSNERMQDTVNEYRTELPDIERLIFSMKPNKIEKRARTGFVYSTEGLVKKISQIEEQGAFRSGLGKRMTTQELGAFLYKINFLVACKTLDNGYMDRKYFEENKYLFSKLYEFGYEWEVHPAYRWALQPDSTSSVFESLRLISDDEIGGDGPHSVSVSPPGM